MVCEFFMDYSYNGEIATEAIKPVQAIINVVQKIWSVLQRLFNNFKRLRKIYIPVDLYDISVRINNQFNKCAELINSATVDRLIFNGTEEELNENLETLDEGLDIIENQDIYTVFMSATPRDKSLFKDEYKEEPSKEVVDDLNRCIKMMADLRGQLNSVMKEPTPSQKNGCRILIRFCKMRIKFYTKLFSFRKPLRDPKNITRTERPIYGTAVPQNY